MSLDYSLAIKDVNGWTIGGTTKKINSGTAIDLNAINFSIAYKKAIELPMKANKKLTTSVRFKDRLPDISDSGMEATIINITCIIDLEASATSIATHVANSETFTYLTFPLLFDLITVPQILYLRDYVGAGATYSPPIDQLISHTDFFDQTDWGSNNNIYGANGMPVTVMNATVERVEKSEQGHLMTVKLSLRGVDPD